MFIWIILVVGVRLGEMRRSKLVLCIDIATLLMQKGPLKLDEIVSKSKSDSESAKYCISLLVGQGDVKEDKISSLETFYFITPRGIRLLKFFNVPGSFHRLKSSNVRVNRHLRDKSIR